MKAMIISDLITLKKQMVQSTAFLTIAVLAISLMTGGSPLVLLYVAPIMATIALQCLQQEEGKAGWERSRLAMPLSRKQVIAGRYASLAIVVVASTVLGAAVCLATAGVFYATPTLAQFAVHPLPADAATFALAFGGVVGGTLILLGLLLPFIARFGAVDGMRYAPGLVLTAVMLAYLALFSSGMLQNGSLPQPDSFTAALVLALGLTAMGAAFYVASSTIALRLYNQRDF